MRVKMWTMVFLFTLLITVSAEGMLSHREKVAFAKISSDTEDYRRKVTKKLDEILDTLKQVQKEQAAIREELTIIKVRASR